MLMGTSFLAWLGWIGFSFICLVFTFNNALKISFENFGDMTIRLLHTSKRFPTHYGNSSGSHVPSRSNYVNLFVKKFFHWTLVVYLSLETMDSHYVDMNNLEFPLCECARRKTLFNESFSRNLDHSLVQGPLKIWTEHSKPPIASLRSNIFLKKSVKILS